MNNADCCSSNGSFFLQTELVSLDSQRQQKRFTPTRDQSVSLWVRSVARGRVFVGLGPSRVHGTHGREAFPFLVAEQIAFSAFLDVSC